MRRASTHAPTWPELVGGMFGMLWRCRLELVLGGGVVLGFLLLAA